MCFALCSAFFASTLPLALTMRKRKREAGEVLWKGYLDKINETCGTRMTGKINWPTFAGKIPDHTVAADKWCGIFETIFLDLCKDEVGKRAAQAVTSLECKQSTGKEDTPTTKIYVTGNGKKTTYDYARGKLTIGIVADPAWWFNLADATLEGAWPAVVTDRAVTEFEAKEKDSWDQLMAELDLKLTREIDREAFTHLRDFLPYLCKDGLHATLRSLNESKKGNAALKKFKKVQCTATMKKGSIAPVKGDTLYYVSFAEPNGPDAYSVTTGNADQIKKALKLGN
jgi:hypothetical protein